MPDDPLEVLRKGLTALAASPAGSDLSPTLAACLAALTALEHERANHRIHEARTEAIQQGLVAIAGRDFSTRLPLAEDGSVLDGIAAAVNMLCEEIEAYVTSLWKHQQTVQQREQQLWEARKTDAVGRLAGGIAHEFNNLLGIMQGHLELLRSSRGFVENERPRLNAIWAATERASSLVQQLLLHAGRQVVTFDLVNFGDLLTHLAPTVEALVGKAVTVTVEVSPKTLPRISGNRAQMEVLILNLVLNSRDAMPNGGTVVVSAADVGRTDGHDTISPPMPPGRYVQLSVSDTGHGMDEDTRSRMFEPFFTTKPVGRGTGLGLAVVSGIVTRHDGHMAVTSIVGRGTTVTVWLPASEPSKPARPAGRLPQLRGRRHA